MEGSPIDQHTEFGRIMSGRFNAMCQDVFFFLLKYRYDKNPISDQNKE